MSYGSVPVPPPPPAIVRQPSWFSRNWKWFLPTVILGPLLLITLFIGGIFAFVSGLMKSSEPYHRALAAAENNPQVVRELGEPLEPGFWSLSGSINETNSTGDAEITIPLKGKLRQGKVHVVAKESGGVWTYQTMDISIDGDPAPIQLMPPQKDKD